MYNQQHIFKFSINHLKFVHTLSRTQSSTKQRTMQSNNITQGSSSAAHSSGDTGQYEFKEEALPFIIYDAEQRKFTLTKESTEYLSAIQGPIGLVAVAGLYRTGKSYLLNRMLLNRSDGFGVGPTINACTKGLWVWGKPIAGHTPDGEPLSVLIVDTEGLGALDEDSNHDVRIFSLAILLSSFFIYNSVGSIDESALQNLSLVINLTKNIQIKSRVSDGMHGSGDDQDIEEYGIYFPSFMWVVRDFTLQLVDEEGEPLTSKEYLEKALESQKGFSDSVEQKNRIRRLLKSFFKERDCSTMIRPLTNEEDLQNLANLDLDELRPDFVEQVLQLRRKVVNRVKAKTLNGKKLSGSMLATLAEAYVTAINNGAVPNIETAWSYICKNECQKAMEESITHAETTLQEVVSRLPVQEGDLKDLCKTVKQAALQQFLKRAVGGGEEHGKELRIRIKKVIEQVVEENERVSYQQCLHFLQESYSFIERKLKNREFPGGFAEYSDQDMRSFQQYFMENGPAGPHRQLIMLEFVQRATSEAAEYFGRSISNELELQKSIMSEQKSHLESQLREVKQDAIKDRETFEARLRSTEIERAELSAQESTLREVVQQLQDEKNGLQKDLESQMASLKGDMSREIEDILAKLGHSESTVSELQRKLIYSESEQDKDRALLEQKCEFLERSLADLKKRENDQSHDLKGQKKEHQSQLREMQQKYEVQTKDLADRLDESQERLLEVTSQFEALEQKYNFDQQQWNDSYATLRNTMSTSQGQYSEMQKTLEETKVKARQEYESLQQELSELKEDAQHREEELLASQKERDEELKSARNALEKETALFKQKLEFKEVQVSQLKSSLEEARRTHEETVHSIEGRTREQLDGREVAQKQVSELKESHLFEIQELELLNSKVRQALETQLESLSERHADLELRYKLQEEEFAQETSGLKDQIEMLEQQRQKALDQGKNIDIQKMKLLEQAESRHTLTISQLEQELEDREQRASTDLRELQTKSEEALQQLRNFYEIERERVESRLSEERERANKKLTLQHEEFEQRQADELQQHEDDIEMLQEELRESDRRYQAYQSQAEHENALLVQKIDTLEAYLREKEERLSKEKGITAAQIDAQMERFTTERKELFAKIDLLTSSITGKDRELTVSRNKVESLTEEVEKRRRQVDEQRTELAQDRLKLNEKIDQLRLKNQELADEHMQRRLEDGREIALYKQKLEFQQKKIDELQLICDQQYSKFDERYTQQKQEHQQELQEIATRFTQTREQTELKYETKRRHYKEQEQALLKQLSDVNKEKAVLDEKNANSELKKEELRVRAETELSILREQLQSATDSLSREREIFMAESDRLRSNAQEQERELSEVEAAYERDRALWDGKFQFLESQRDQAKSDLVEATRKFEMTLEQLQRRGCAEKDKIEHSQHTLLGNIESKFKQQLRDQGEQAQREKSDMTEKVRNLEKENRQLLNRLQLEQRDKMSEQGSLSKKVQDLMENEGRLQRELDEIKLDRDRRISESSRLVEKEREALKLKIQEVEVKCKDVEARRSALIFEVERDRTKWGLERDHILSQKQEVQEHVDRLQRKAEDLLKENEKLKSDRSLRKQQYMHGGPSAQVNTFGNQGPLSKFVAGNYGQQFKAGSQAGSIKENNVASSQMFGQGFSKYNTDGVNGPQTEGKPDPYTLPFAKRENSSHMPQSSVFATSIRARMGSPSQNPQPLSLTSQFLQAAGSKPSALSSGGSSKSGNGSGFVCTNMTGGGPSSTDETNSTN